MGRLGVPKPFENYDDFLAQWGKFVQSQYLKQTKLDKMALLEEAINLGAKVDVYAKDQDRELVKAVLLLRDKGTLPQHSDIFRHRI